jgi:hypothetical protein
MTCRVMVRGTCAHSQGGVHIAPNDPEVGFFQVFGSDRSPRRRHLWPLQPGEKPSRALPSLVPPNVLPGGAAVPEAPIIQVRG